jgi:hypothetical protein
MIEGDTATELVELLELPGPQPDKSSSRIEIVDALTARRCPTYMGGCFMQFSPLDAPAQ